MTYLVTFRKTGFGMFSDSVVDSTEIIQADSKIAAFKAAQIRAEEKKGWGEVVNVISVEEFV